MYGTNIIRSGLTLGKVISGISRGLTIANQVIPIYQQAKPMINNARKVMSVLKELKDTPITTKKPEEKTTIITTESTEKKASLPKESSSTANPVFFQ